MKHVWAKQSLHAERDQYQANQLACNDHDLQIEGCRWQALPLAQCGILEETRRSNRGPFATHMPPLASDNILSTQRCSRQKALSGMQKIWKSWMWSLGCDRLQRMNEWNLLAKASAHFPHYENRFPLRISAYIIIYAVSRLWGRVTFWARIVVKWYRRLEPPAVTSSERWHSERGW